MYHLTNPLHFFMIASSFRRRELGLVFRPIMRSSYNIMVGVDFIRLGLRRILGILDSIFGDFRVCIFLSLYNPKRLGEDQEGPLRFRKEHTSVPLTFSASTFLSIPKAFYSLLKCVLSKASLTSPSLFKGKPYIALPSFSYPPKNFHILPQPFKVAF
jgi:hypothetical protein